MTPQLYNGHAILVSGNGQCSSCATGIYRILVQQGQGRSWHTVDLGLTGYIPHTCNHSLERRPPRRAA